MLLIKEITEDPRQKHTLILPDGSQFAMSLEFKPLQLGWFVTNFTYGDFIINNFRIVTLPNMLRQWKNRLRFGLGCFTNDTSEPTQIQDFSSGRAKLYVLTAEEVDQYEEFLRG